MSNNITVMGNLTRDPFKNDKVVILQIADNRVGKWAKDNYETNFFQVFFNAKDGVFDVQAQIAMEKRKGDFVVVIGELGVKEGKEYKGKKEKEHHILNPRLYGPKSTSAEETASPEANSKAVDDAFGGI